MDYSILAEGVKDFHESLNVYAYLLPTVDLSAILLILHYRMTPSQVDTLIKAACVAVGPEHVRTWMELDSQTRDLIVKESDLIYGQKQRPAGPTGRNRFVALAESSSDSDQEEKKNRGSSKEKKDKKDKKEKKDNKDKKDKKGHKEKHAAPEGDTDDAGRKTVMVEALDGEWFAADHTAHHKEVQRDQRKYECEQRTAKSKGKKDVNFASSVPRVSNARSGTRTRRSFFSSRTVGGRHTNW